MVIRKKVSDSDKYISSGRLTEREKAATNILLRIPNPLLDEIKAQLEDTPWITRTAWIVDAIKRKIGE